jgi:uncharacterized protein YjbI with pentapeptide repeats
MANKKHLAILKQGVEAWNQWRNKNRGIRPDLSEADLSEATLNWADLHGAYLREANLRGANLIEAELSGANLRGVNLSGADLNWADLGAANLIEAELSGADLRGANLRGANLRGADFTRSIVHGTAFANLDLSNVKGLDTIEHLGPSTIGIDTIYRSQGKIPESFLRGAGVPENFIAYMHSLAGQAFDYYSCFISYSSKDQDFAKLLHARLQQEGVRCWYAPEDLKIGDEFRQRIDDAIRLHDKLLVVLSEHSVESRWVKDEVEGALEKERQQNKLVLFPIQLDDAVMTTTQAWAASLRRQRHIGDFTKWKDHDSYQKAFERLLRDLQGKDAQGAAAE